MKTFRFEKGGILCRKRLRVTPQRYLDFFRSERIMIYFIEGCFHLIREFVCRFYAKLIKSFVRPVLKQHQSEFLW